MEKTMKITVQPSPIDHEQGIEAITKAGLMSNATLLGYTYYDDNESEVAEDDDDASVVYIFLETDLSKEIISEMIGKANDWDIINSIYETETYDGIYEL